MKVVRAETAGFCMGVDLALRKLERLLEQGSETPIFTYGPIIHNPQVLEDFRKQGVGVVNTPHEMPVGSSVVIRAHGIPCHVQKELDERQSTITDATCPKVKKAQLLIRKHAEKGRFVLLYGEEDHPEVRGLVSYASEGYTIFDSIEELRALKLTTDRLYCLAAQTTQDKALFKDIAAELEQISGIDIVVLETICEATKSRQAEAIEIARKVDFMVVVGGFESGNTRRLAKVVQAQGTPCIHVESASEIPVEKLDGVNIVGLTAGASTPKKIIDEVHTLLEGLQ